MYFLCPFRDIRWNKDTSFSRGYGLLFTKASRTNVLETVIRDLRSQATAGEYAKLVRVTGSVHFPGEYPLTKSMSLQDLVRAAVARETQHTWLMLKLHACLLTLNKLLLLDIFE